MTIIRQRLHGHLLTFMEPSALFLDENGGSILVSYALIERETGFEVLPEVALDDWGHEIKGLELYEWVKENGPRFPRAEVFGYDLGGSERQYFLRELDLTAKYPCYGYRTADSPIRDGILVGAVLLPGQELSEPLPAKVPDEITMPLRRARVSWWQVSPDRLDGINWAALGSGAAC